MFNKRFLAAASCLLLIALPSSGYAANKYCFTQSPNDIYVHVKLYETGLEASVLAALLAGHTHAAASALGHEISSTIIMLNSQIAKNPCNIPETTIKRIYPLLRVVAAVNHRHPIPGIDGNKQVQQILRRAIANDPSHYKALLRRARHWDNGIN